MSDTPEDQLTRALMWALHSVRESSGYYDTARQILIRLKDLFPDQVESARVIAELRAEVNRLEFQRDSAVMQLRAHIARAGRKAMTGGGLDDD